MIRVLKLTSDATFKAVPSGVEVCMFYNRLFIIRERSWKLAVSGWCCHTYCLDGRNTHKIQAYIYIKHITNIHITNIFIYM